MKLRCRAPLKVALFAMAACSVSAFATAAQAQERTDFKEEWNNVLGAIGFGHDRDAIDYTPRAPIVVPPTNNLPQPSEGIRRSAGFPDDPDVVARRKSLIDPRQPVPPTDSGLASKTRAYLIQPPAPYFDASAVAATGNDADRGDAATDTPKKSHRRRAQAQ